MGVVRPAEAAQAQGRRSHAATSFGLITLKNEIHSNYTDKRNPLWPRTTPAATAREHSVTPHCSPVCLRVGQELTPVERSRQEPRDVAVHPVLDPQQRHWPAGLLQSLAQPAKEAALRTVLAAAGPAPGGCGHAGVGRQLLVVPDGHDRPAPRRPAQRATFGGEAQQGRGRRQGRLLAVASTLICVACALQCCSGCTPRLPPFLRRIDPCFRLARPYVSWDHGARFGRWSADSDG